MLAEEDRLFIAIIAQDNSLKNMLFSNQDASLAGQSLPITPTALHVCTLAR